MHGARCSVKQNMPRCGRKGMPHVPAWPERTGALSERIGRAGLSLIRKREKMNGCEMMRGPVR